MKKYIYSSLILFVITLFILCSSCSSQEEVEESIQNTPQLSLTVNEDLIPADFVSIEADFGFSGVGNLLTFDVEIHNYNPQTYSIGFALPVSSDDFFPQEKLMK